MSLRALRLETFTPEARGLMRDDHSEAEAEEARLVAYEQGHRAGWDDAIAAQSGDLTRLRTDLGQNLQDLSFTYHEAHSHVLRSLEPLLRDMVSVVLPVVARETLAPILLGELKPLAAELAGAPVEIVTHPDNLALVEDLVVARAGFPATLRGEPTLGRGQVHFRTGASERVVDLDGALAAMTEAVSAFFHIAKEESRAHG
ncbi:MAG: flagellar biosynthesis protein [Proteobacteria bacterium]|nr:flagellar biosynthesis protein [Pseudomonadota bacterium]